MQYNGNNSWGYGDRDSTEMILSWVSMIIPINILRHCTLINHHFGMVCAMYMFSSFTSLTSTIFYLKSTSIHQTGSESPKKSSAPVMWELNQVWQNESSPYPSRLKYHGLKMGHRPGPLCSAPRGSKCVGKKNPTVRWDESKGKQLRMNDFFVGQNPSPQLPTPMYTWLEIMINHILYS